MIQGISEKDIGNTVDCDRWFANNCNPQPSRNETQRLIVPRLSPHLTKTERYFCFIRLATSGDATLLTIAAPVVTAEGDLSEGALLRELVENTGSYREEEMEDTGSESSGLSELESEEEEKEWDQKDSGRPNFKHAAPGAE